MVGTVVIMVSDLALVGGLVIFAAVLFVGFLYSGGISRRDNDPV